MTLDKYWVPRGYTSIAKIKEDDTQMIKVEDIKDLVLSIPIDLTGSWREGWNDAIKEILGDKE